MTASRRVPRAPLSPPHWDPSSVRRERRRQRRQVHVARAAIAARCWAASRYSTRKVEAPEALPLARPTYRLRAFSPVFVAIQPDSFSLPLLAPPVPSLN